jgi:hypothetical protein
MGKRKNRLGNFDYPRFQFVSIRSNRWKWPQLNGPACHSLSLCPSNCSFYFGTQRSKWRTNVVLLSTTRKVIVATISGCLVFVARRDANGNDAGLNPPTKMLARAGGNSHQRPALVSIFAHIILI